MSQDFYRYFSLFGLIFLRKKNFDQLRLLEKDVYLFLKDIAKKNGVNPEHIKSQIYQDVFVLYIFKVAFVYFCFKVTYCYW